MRRVLDQIGAFVLLAAAAGCPTGAEPNPFTSAGLGDTQDDGDDEPPAFDTGDGDRTGGADLWEADSSTGGGTPDVASSTTGEDDGTTGSGSGSGSDDNGTTVAVEPGSTTVVDETTTGVGTTGMAQGCPDASIMAVPANISDSTSGQDDQFASTCGGVGAPDMSFTFTAPAAGNYRVATAGSQLDTVISVLEGGCGGEQLVCNDDDGCGGNSASALVVALQAAQEVTIVVDGFGLIGDDFNLSVSGCSDCAPGAKSDCGGGTTGGIGS